RLQGCRPGAGADRRRPRPHPRAAAADDAGRAVPPGLPRPAGAGGPGPEPLREGLMVALPIYLDNHATTRVDPRVLEAMLPYFGEHYGNAASRHHAFGQRAEEAVQQAREQVAELIGGGPREIVFTSGATESTTLAIKGVAAAYRARGDHLVTVATEHRAVLDPCRRLERAGFRVTYLPVDRHGRVAPEQVAAALT